MMKTNVQQTSLEAYYNEVPKNIDGMWREIVMVFQENPGMDFTNKEILEELRYGDPSLDINNITPRVYELRGKDKRHKEWQAHPILVESRKRICTIGHKNAIAWQLNNK